MKGLRKTVIFDCDGTILVTFKLIEQVVIDTFKIIKPDYKMSIKEAHTFFGPFLNDSFSKYFETEQEVNYAVEVYRKLCEELTPKYVVAYESIEEMLKELKQKGYLIAMVSNKVTEAILQGLNICGLTKYFDLIVGAEKLAKAKPDPDGIYQVFDKFKTLDSVLVGDTLIDMSTARNAGIDFIGVTWCQTTKETFINNGVRYIVDNALQIIDILEKKYELC